MAVGRVADQRGSVIVEDEPVEPPAAQRAQHGRRVVVPLAQEAFGERRHGAAHVPQVDVGDLAPRRQVADRVQHRLLTAHLRDGAQAQFDTEAGTRPEVRRPAQRPDVAEDPGHAAELADRGVVGVHRQADAGLLGGGRHRADEVLEGGPHGRVVPLAGEVEQRPPGPGVLLVLDPPVAPGHVDVTGPAGLARQVQVERGHHRATAAVRSHRGPPDRGRHPVEAEDRDAGPAHVRDRRDDVLDLLVPPGHPEHGAGVEAVRQVLDRFEPEPVRLHPLAQGDQVASLPALLTRQVRRVELHACRADLAGERQVLMRRPGGLPDRDAHHHVLTPLRAARRRASGSGTGPGR